MALLNGEADLAVHSLKDLPTELPAGLVLGAVGKRADVRDVLVYRDAKFVQAEAARQTTTEWVPGQKERRGFKAHLKLKDLPHGVTVATSSTRRRAQMLVARPDAQIVEIRGNVPTRLRKLAEQNDFDATLLAAAHASS